MSRIDKLRTKAAKIEAELDAIEKAEEARDDDEGFTSEEREKYKALTAQLEAVNEDIKAAERANAAKISDWKNRRGVESGELVESNGTAATFDDGARVTSGEGQHGPYKFLGQQLTDIAAMDHPSAPKSQRTSAEERLTKVAEAQGASSLRGSDGAFLIQTDFSTAMLDRGVQASALAQYCFPIPVSAGSDAVDLPLVRETSKADGQRWGGVRVYRRKEAETVEKSKPGFDKLTIELEDLMAIAYATDRVLRDAPMLGAIFGRAFQSEFSFVLDHEIFDGDGNGECLGFMKSDALVTIAKETGQAADTVEAENVMKMFARMPPRLIGGAAWYINTEVLPQLMLMKVGDTPIYIPGASLANAPYGLLLGKPVRAFDQAKELGDTGDIAFANLGEYALASKGGVESAESMHVRFIYGERTFRWIHPINGAPGWKSAVTPLNGSADRSPFVVLADRA